MADDERLDDDDETAGFWRNYFGEGVAEEEIRAMARIAILPYADHDGFEMLEAYRQGRGDLESARAAAVALEQECAVLSDALALFTHEYQAQVIRPGHCHCGLRADNIQHRTPTFLRKRYGLGV